MKRKVLGVYPDALRTDPVAGPSPSAPLPFRGGVAFASMVARKPAKSELYTLTCRLCKFRLEVPVLEGIRPGMTREAATADVVERTIRAENEFFRDHWQHEHPDEAAEIIHHIAMVTKLARVSAYHRWAIDAQFEGLAGESAAQ